MKVSPSKAGPAVGKLFLNGRSQAVRLPQAYRFQGTRVKITRLGNGLFLEPLIDDVPEWFAALDRLGDTFPLEKNSRNQPVTPKRDIFK